MQEELFLPKQSEETPEGESSWVRWVCYLRLT